MGVCERRVVVVGQNIDRDGLGVAQWRGRAAAAVRHLHGVGGFADTARRIWLSAVLSELQLGCQIGCFCCCKDATSNDRFAAIDNAIAVGVKKQGALAAVVNSRDSNGGIGQGIGCIAQCDGGRHHLDLAFDQGRAAADGRRLVRGVDGDADSAVRLPAAAVADGDIEAVGDRGGNVGAVVRVLQAAQATHRNNLPDGDGAAQVAQRALRRQAADDQHLLADDLLASGDVHIECVGAAGKLGE